MFAGKRRVSQLTRKLIKKHALIAIRKTINSYLISRKSIGCLVRKINQARDNVAGEYLKLYKEKNKILEGKESLHEEQPVGPLDEARENLEKFADSLIIQDTLKKLVDWLLVLEVILEDPDASELEKQQTIQEIKYIEEAWTAMADSFFERGISA